MKFRWITQARNDDECARLAAAVKISPLLARCLLNRGFSEPDVVAQFLQPRLKNLADPFLLPNMAQAVDALFAARDRGETVVIFGDYDVDGVTATALLLESLGKLGWKVGHYLPHRFDEGYGFSQDAAGHCLQQNPCQLILAVDCGSTAFQTIANLAARGIGVIVLDHHQVSKPAPEALALVNPQLGSDFQELCSVGLAFKLIHAIVKKMRESGSPLAAEFDLRECLDLVALGTIADLVPLRGENRILVTSGLEKLNASRRPGLLALRTAARCPERLGQYEVGFQLGPRLNAAGRMQTAEDALRLLLAPNAAEAEPLARTLDERNRERQDIERAICKEVIESVRARFNGEKDFVIVEGHQKWHIGVVGIVAARVLQEFYRPTIILGGDGDMWRGSGRSIEGFDLAGALQSCTEFLARHGGHAMAAGVTLAEANVHLFRDRLNGLARESLGPSLLQPSLAIDGNVKLSDLSLAQVEELAQLDPSGQGNPVIRLSISSLRLQQPGRSIGKENQHAKFRVTDGRDVMDVLWWNCAQLKWPDNAFDIAVTVSINEYQGRRAVQLKMLDWRSAT